MANCEVLRAFHTESTEQAVVEFAEFLGTENTEN
jgi:hypothetical protein